MLNALDTVRLLILSPSLSVYVSCVCVFFFVGLFFFFANEEISIRLY